MRLTDDCHLTYCMNVHPGEDWADQRRAIAGEACAVKAALAPDRPFGLGLRLGRQSAGTLAAPAAREDLRKLLAAHGLYVFTVNAFPYGPFHNQPVKTDVYAPDCRGASGWTTRCASPACWPTCCRRVSRAASAPSRSPTGSPRSSRRSSSAYASTWPTRLCSFTAWSAARGASSVSASSPSPTA